MARVPRHGTLSEYTNYHCRCKLCRAANTAYNLKMREDRSGRISDLSEEDHGHYSTYTNWKCRCGRCREANAARSRMEEVWIPS